MTTNIVENTSAPNWSDVHHWRQRFRHVFPDVLRLPIQPSMPAWLCAHIRTLARQGAKQISILDVGAGDRSLALHLDSVKNYIDYKSQDIDRVWPHDYYDTREITEQFDLVVSAEVIEHMDAAAKIPFIAELFRLTKPNGWVALTTPNACHANIFWRDFTHVNAIHYYDLAGLLGRAGFTDIGIHRLAKMNWRKRLTVWWYRRLLKLLHVDFAQSIMAVARKPV